MLVHIGAVEFVTIKLMMPLSLGIDLLYSDTKFPYNGVQLADCKVAATSLESAE